MVDAMARRYATLRDEAVSLLPMALSVLGRLREHGLKLGLLTNGSTDKQWAKIRQFDLARFFDHIQVEGDVGFGKPDLRAFRRALAALDVVPDGVWMVGDNLVWDIGGAQQAASTPSGSMSTGVVPMPRTASRRMESSHPWRNSSSWRGCSGLGRSTRARLPGITQVSQLPTNAL